ncbi:MAG: hypothetical protein OXH70_12075 [Acidobacteria bacterium]|nr:hypothetical protein [Acidobacteriota bacterium]
MERGYRDEAQRRKVRAAVRHALDGVETPTDFEFAFADLVRKTNPRFLPSLLAGVIEHREALRYPDNEPQSATSAFGVPDGWGNPVEEEACPPGMERNDEGKCVYEVGIELCEVYQEACDDTPDAPLAHDPNMCRPPGFWPECLGLGMAIDGMIEALNECNASRGSSHPQCLDIAREKESTFKAYVCAGCSTAPPPDDDGPFEPSNPAN